MRRAAVAAAVAIAFADSSIVVLALPELYGRFHASIVGVSWVITAYNAAVAVMALALLLFAHRMDAGRLQLDFTSLDLSLLIEAELDDLGAQPDTLDLTIEADVPAGDAEGVLEEDEA